MLNPNEQRLNRI